MIEVHALTKRFGPFTALDDVSFSVPRGSVTGFLGQNGAGKTTTLRMLACFLPPTTGWAKIDGLDTVAQSLSVRRRIGYLPESVPLYGEMRVDDFLAFRARLKGVIARGVKAAVDEALTLCLLTDVRRRLVADLSKGFRQRVGLADAIVHKPPLLILDEPTSGLDPTQRVQVRDLIRNLGTERTVLVSTHILPEVEATCDRVILIHRGRLMTEASLTDLRAKGALRLRWRGGTARVEGVATDADGAHAVSSPDAAAASRLAGRIVEGGGTLLELAPESLEAVFTRLTAASDA